MTPRLFLASRLALLLGSPVAAQDPLLDLETAVLRAASEQADLVTERARREAEAAALAEAVEGLKAREAGPRAGRELAERLRDFDRLASVLDDLDAHIARAADRVQRVREDFESAVERESRRLARLPGSEAATAAHGLSALDEARRRVEDATAVEPAFRPVLDVAPAPGDGAPELERKRRLLEAEQERVRAELARLGARGRVLAARAEQKRTILARIQAARRAGGAARSLLEREADALRLASRRLARRVEQLDHQGREMQAALEGLDSRIRDVQERLHGVVSHNPREAP